MCKSRLKCFGTYLNKIRVGVEAHAKDKREAQSLIAQVLMANNTLNPAQRASLIKAKDLLNDR